MWGQALKLEKLIEAKRRTVPRNINTGLLHHVNYDPPVPKHL